MSATPQYTIRLRDASLNPQGALSAWTNGDLMLRMNDVGKWALTVRADDPLRQYFVRGAGIIVSRDRGDGSGAQTLMSGPIWTMDRLGKDNFFTLGGPTDEWWLKARRALPQGGRPYMEQTLIKSPGLYWRLGEASGTTAADTSGNARPGTYAGGVTYGVVGSVPGDPDTAVTLNGTTGQATASGISGLPSGNQAWTIRCAVKVAAYPGASAFFWNFGANVAAQVANLYMTTTGGIVASQGGGGTHDTAASAAVSTNTWHLCHATWDGTTLRGYLDGTQFATATPGAMSIPASATVSLGAGLGASGFLGGSLDEAAILAGAFAAADVTADYVSWSATHGAYDTRTGLASTVMRAYVNANLVAATNIDRNLAALALAADPSVGTTVTGNARYDELLALCQQLASSGGDIGFKVVQTANGVLTFSVYQPADKSANAKFSQDLQDLHDYAYSLAGPQANSVEVLGGGTGASRTALRMSDQASIGNWGLVEGVRDARDTSDVPTMQQRGQADINALSEQTNLALTPRDTDAVQYGRDYNLGDIVAVTIDGNTIVQKVRSVHIQLKSPDQELVVPGIGNPSQGEVARWFDAYAARQQALQQVQAQLNRLSAAQ